ncbi:esterase-like activity of phytase family protein [Streptomyces sp. XM4193]|uniref:esterase-like activity of phytase family protein n=1 Tax=Streptomyces sp. XM4193 TaxID=2929782 RepID=UPI001FFB32EC|nr:esterase-like activity of phytase family protein [Streptomyces sp. XM4193]MCK1795347.1 esterase-like activity of phytase family protein [Streptomyces sp. XM4193]
MRKRLRALGVVLAVLATGAFGAASAAAAEDEGPTEAFTLKDPRIKESSGLAASRAHKGVYWTHNDSGYQPMVYAVDSATGETVAAITLTGVEGRDLEAVSVGPDGNVHIADIGDNFGGRWEELWIYRFPEPEKLVDQTLQPTVFRIAYDDGKRDAESLAVHPKTGRVYIVGKNEDGDGLYRGPEELTTEGVNTFERIAEIDLWATDAAFSPDGSRLAVRGYFGGIMYDFAGGRPERLSRLQVPLQRQGESVTFTPDGKRLLYGSEGEASEVKPVELHGDQRPADVQKKDESGKGSGGGSDPDSPQADGNLLLGAATFAAAVAIWLGLRRVIGSRKR